MSETPRLKLEPPVFLLFICLAFCFWATPGGAQSLVLALYSGITPNELWGPCGMRFNLGWMRARASPLYYRSDSFSVLLMMLESQC